MTRTLAILGAAAALLPAVGAGARQAAGAKPQAPLPAPAKGGAPNVHARRSPTLETFGIDPATHPLTLDEAVAITLATNRSVDAAIDAWRKARGVVNLANAGYLPTAGATGTYTHLDKGQSFTINGHNLQIVNQNQELIALQATLPVDIVGQIRAAADQAHFGEVAARLDVNRARNQAVADVKTAFYNALHAQALVQVANENLADTQARLDDAQKRFEARTVAKFDVIRAQTDVANAQLQSIQARSGLNQAIAALNQTIGIDVNSPTRLSDAGAVGEPPAAATGATAPSAMAPPASADSLDLGPDYDAVYREALANRPEILEAMAGVAAAKKGIVVASKSELPAFGITANAQYNPSAVGFAPVTTSGSIVFQLQVPLYDAGFARAKREQARADVESALTGQRTAEDGVALDVRSAWLALVQARQSVVVADQALTQAREGFRLARVRYNAGVASTAGGSPLLEVSDAQNALTQAETNQVNALYAYNSALAALDRAAGRYAYQAGGQGYGAAPKPRDVGAPAPGGMH